MSIEIQENSDGINIGDDGGLPREFVLYMDLLGVEHIVKNELEKVQMLREVIQILSSNNKEFNIEYIETPDHFFEISSFNPAISNSADSVIVRFPSSNIYPLGHNSITFVINSLVSIASQIHRIALERGILVRGAITEGWQYPEIGRAQIDAVRLEQEKSVYPRVIISDNIANLFTKNSPAFLVRKDDDGIYFIDYLRHLPVMLGQGSMINDTLIPAFLNIRAIIEANIINLSIVKNDRALKKWKWLAKRFNDSLDYCQRFESVKEQLNKLIKFDATLLLQ